MAGPAKTRTWIVMAIAAAAGFAAWFITAAFSTAREPWDSPLYARVTFPALCCLGLALTLVDRRRGWLTAIPLMLTQPIGFLISNGLGALWPLSIALYLVVGVFLAALLGLLKLAVDAILGRPPELRPGGCTRCGYDLTGNVSGTCPECGRPAPHSMDVDA